MAGREKPEEKLKAMFTEWMDERDARRTEEDDPNKSWLRKAMREEIGAALSELLNDQGDAGRGRGRANRRTDDDDGGGESEGGVFDWLTGKRTG